MNKNSLIAHFLTALGLVVLSAIAQHFVEPKYWAVTGLSLGIPYFQIKPAVQKFLDSRDA